MQKPALSKQYPDARIRSSCPEALGYLSVKYKYAGIFRQIIAEVIDLFILAIIMTIIKNMIKDFFSYKIIELIYLILENFIFIFYFIFLWYKFNGTIGNFIMKSKIVSADKTPLNLKRLIIRFFIFILSHIFFLGFLYSLNDAKRRTWHDKLANTLVIKI